MYHTLDETLRFLFFFFFSSRRRHTRWTGDWSSDVCSSDLIVSRVAGDKPLPADIVDRIIERADGIPLFIEELTKALLESGTLRERNGVYVMDGALRSSRSEERRVGEELGAWGSADGLDGVG